MWWQWISSLAIWMVLYHMSDTIIIVNKLCWVCCEINHFLPSVSQHLVLIKYNNKNVDQTNKTLTNLECKNIIVMYNGSKKKNCTKFKIKLLPVLGDRVKEILVFCYITSHCYCKDCSLQTDTFPEAVSHAFSYQQLKQERTFHWKKYFCLSPFTMLITLIIFQP